MPEVQREQHIDVGGGEAHAMKNRDEGSTTSSPSPTLTPAEFFRTKPR